MHAKNLQLNNKYVWAKEGKSYMREDDDLPSIWINNDVDLNKS